MMALTDKQQRFADEYLIDMNATAAYLRAGYTAKGNSAEVNASRLLRNAKVQEYIESKQIKLQEKTGMTQEWVLQKYMELIERADDNVVRASLADVGKHLGMFKERIEHSGTLRLEDMLDKLL